MALHAAIAEYVEHDERPTEDHHVHISGATWSDYEGMDKLEIYRRLGVAEVWYWRRGELQAHALRDNQYEPVPRSRFLPDLDLDLLVSFIDRPTTSQAIRDFRAAIQRQ